MNWVDFAILMVFFAFATEGLRRGLFSQLLDIIGLLVSLIASLAFYPLAATFLKKLFNLPIIAANPIGFLLIWLLVETIFFKVFSRSLANFLKYVVSKPMEKYLGFIPSVINALLFSAFILLFVVSLPINPLVKKDIFNSRIGSALVEKASIVEKPFNSIFGPIAKQGLTFLTVAPQQKEAIALEFEARRLTVDAASEKRMLELVNKERGQRDIKPLIWDENLAAVGSVHSTDMFKRKYFSHYSQEGKDVGDRLTEAGIDYTVAGENLALAPDVVRAHDGLMNSTGHKRNILDPAFNKVGIGIIDGEIYGKMFTQVFTN